MINKFKILVFVLLLMLLTACSTKINEKYGYTLYQSSIAGCADMIEEIYTDDNYTYYFPCLESDRYTIKDESGNSYTVYEIIENDLLSIEELFILFDGNLVRMEAENTSPIFVGIEDITINLNQPFDLLEGIEAYDFNGSDISSDIEIQGDLDKTTVGNYELTYIVTDSDGKTTSMSRTITVEYTDFIYPSGVYNYEFVDPQIRQTFMAAAEKYLLDTMAGGVPVYTNASYNVYSERLILPTDKYIPLIGYGELFATMSLDDSHVLMYDGIYGNEGEYTYRDFTLTNPNTFNQYFYENSFDKKIISQTQDTLYAYRLNTEKNGYEIIPSMADGNPVAINGSINQYGTNVSNTWQISIKDNLNWFINPDTETIESIDTSTYDLIIDANDFVETYKLALDKKWYRMINGEFDFTNSVHPIFNATEYANGNANWEDVGIKLIDSNTIEFKFTQIFSEWEVKNYFSSILTSPIQFDLYLDLGGNLLRDEEEGSSNGTYATSPTTTAYSGAYYFENYEENLVLELKENPSYHNQDEYFYTNIDYAYTSDHNNTISMFEAGKLEATILPYANIDDYIDYSGLRIVPGTHTYNIMINGLATQENQLEIFPDSEYIPEPILSNQDFKLAMYYAIDREYLANDVMKSVIPSMYLFSEAYLVEQEIGIAYRYTEEGISVGEDLSPTTLGYNESIAISYFLKAIEDSLLQGYYEPGTSETDMTEIIIDLYINDGDDDIASFGTYIKEQFESIFIDNENYIKVIINIIPKGQIDLFYNYMLTGEFDLALGGFPGSTLDLPSFLQLFCDDNRSSFLVNFGINTSSPVIPVEYTDSESMLHKEYWSFNAIASALNGEVIIQDGKEIIIN